MVRWHHRLNGHEFEQAPGLVMDREIWHAAAHGVTKSQIQLSVSLEYFTYFIPLYGEGNGNPLQYSCLAGCSLWGCRELDTTEQLTHTCDATQLTSQSLL